MSPIRRKIKKAAEATEAESTEAEPIAREPTAAGRREWVIAFGIALVLGLPGVLIFLSSNLRWHLLPDGLNKLGLAMVVVLIPVGLLVGLYRLRRPETEREPNPAFDRRAHRARLMPSRHHIKRID